ncbi:hypothetical protein KIPB_002976 [Kipferlia bialata]|uniref:Uncharacterized protein n=1 Tax=Kipferlia bialata TaxID=797122 RepID=A0A391P134_9EUKA|nr:hypothetical protein KIPB_002976 [Kipferlia bialata]|eukprot:g2976.t1
MECDTPESLEQTQIPVGWRDARLHLPQRHPLTLLGREALCPSEGGTEATFIKPVPTETVGSAQALLDQVKTVDTSMLPVHLANLSTYLPLASQVTRGVTALQGFTQKYSETQIVTCDCTGLLQTLAGIYNPLSSARQALSSLDFDATLSVTYVQTVSGILSELDSIRPIPLPLDTTNLSLAEMRLYYRGERFNDEVRTLFTLGDTLIEHQDSIHSCTTALADVGDIDTEGTRQLMQKGESLLALLATLAPRQQVALTLLGELAAVPTVSEADVSDTLSALERLEAGKGGRKWKGNHNTRAYPAVYRRTMDRATHTTLASLQQRLCYQRHSQQKRERIREALLEYTCFPAVAAALQMVQ